MPKSQPTFVDVNQKKIAGYYFGSYWLGCNGRTIQGLCSDSFKSEGELLASYDDCFGESGSAGGVVRVYENGDKVVLRRCPSDEKARKE